MLQTNTSDANFDQIFAALGDPNRLLIVTTLLRRRPHEACVADLTAQLPIGQSTVSHHLRVLTIAGLLTRREDGIHSYFSVTPLVTALLTAVGRHVDRRRSAPTTAAPRRIGARRPADPVPARTRQL